MLAVVAAAVADFQRQAPDPMHRVAAAAVTAWAAAGGHAVSRCCQRHDLAIGPVFKPLGFTSVAGLQREVAAGGKTRCGHAEIELDEAEGVCGDAVGVKGLVHTQLALVAVATVGLQAFLRPGFCLEAARVEAESPWFVQIVHQRDFHGRLRP